jgi:hypothetical protein
LSRKSREYENILAKALEKSENWSYFKKSTHIMSQNVCRPDGGKDVKIQCNKRKNRTNRK